MARPFSSAARIRNFQRNIVRVGTPRYSWLRDFYAGLLRARWPVVLLVFAVAYALVNVLFACLYLAIGDAIVGARPGSFEDAVSFSVQTLSTVGYGVLSPRPPWGNVVVGGETFVGILLVAVATGICFSKFARPRAGMVFSSRLVIGMHEGRRCLMLRLANTRGGEIVEASMRLTAIKKVVTAEGRTMRRLYDMTLERSSTPIVMLTWLAVHPIDASSPLHGLDAEDLRREEVRIIANVTGIEGVFMQTVYLSAMFDAEHIVHDAHFADMLSTRPDGRTQVDLRKLSDVEPAPLKAVAPGAAGEPPGAALRPTSPQSPRAREG
jgi:inward rectifier potassium channel